MDARLARLETSVEFIQRDVGELRADVFNLKVSFARLEEWIRHLPGKGFIVSASVTIIGLLTAIIVLSDKIKALVGVAH